MSTRAEQAEKAITVIVTTSRGSESFTFDKTTTVDEVIREVREHFELTGEGSFSLVRKSDNQELSPKERPLVSFDLEDEEELVLTGGGTNV